MLPYRYKDLLQAAQDLVAGRNDTARHVMARLTANTHWERRVVANAGASLVLTPADHDGKTIYMTGTGAAKTLTLPTLDAGTVGFKCKVFIGEVNTSNHLVKSARGADVMRGILLGRSATDSATDAARTWEAGSTDDTITLNGTTTGGAVIGDQIEIEGVAINVWSIHGIISQSGSEATPFSDTVT